MGYSLSELLDYLTGKNIDLDKFIKSWRDHPSYAKKRDFINLLLQTLDDEDDYLKTANATISQQRAYVDSTTCIITHADGKIEMVGTLPESLSIISTRLIREAKHD